MPLYTLIFLTECNCMSEEAFKVIQEFGDYYLTEDRLCAQATGQNFGKGKVGEAQETMRGSPRVLFFLYTYRRVLDRKDIFSLLS